MNLAAKYLRDNSSRIIQTWEHEVQSQILVSFKTHSLALRNQLPHVLGDISEIMDRYDDFILLFGSP